MFAINMQVLKFDNIDSTNTYAKSIIANKICSEETVIYTYNQTKGKGLGKNIWLSEGNKNLTFTLISFKEIEVKYHFYISMIVSLSICDYAKNKGVNLNIKWPNDIYFENKKICGILIENTICGDVINNSIIGVGFNLNQETFPSNLPNPVSMFNITRKSYNIDEEINSISKVIFEKLLELKPIGYENIKSEYLSKLFRFNEYNNFLVEDKVIEAKIIDVKSSGHLVIQKKSGEIEKFYFKEIEFVI